MTPDNKPLDTLHDIKQMMERSSRFISLSGLSGIAAGICALVGAWLANRVLVNSGRGLMEQTVTIHQYNGILICDTVKSQLLTIAAIMFVAAFVLAFLFTYLRSKKSDTPLWGPVSKRLMTSICIPMVAGGIYLLKLSELGYYGLIAPGCLLFYGLALINASRFTLGEVKYLGYSQLALGIIGCWFVGYGLFFWAVGFGVLHIVYGFIMWNRYERLAN